MSTITFDTLKFANTLKEAGVPDRQAEAESRALAEAFAANSSDLATKGDLNLLEVKFDAKFALVQWMLAAVLVLAIANFAKQYF